MDPAAALSEALAGSLLRDFDIVKKIGGKDVTPGGMVATTTMHGVCSYVYIATSRRPAAAAAGQLALKVSAAAAPFASSSLNMRVHR